MTKKQQKLRKYFEEIVKKFNGVCISNDLCEIYEFKTVVGTLRVTAYADSFDFIPLIFGLDFDYAKFMSITYDESINRNSYKWNLHSSDQKFNLERLDRRLSILS